MAHQRVPDGERVIGARPGKAEAEDVGRDDPHQAFLEIGRVLFGHMQETVRRDRRAGAGRHRIEIPDHAVGKMAGAHRLIGATIGRYQSRSEPERGVERILAEPTAPDERDWQRGMDNICYHGRIDGD